MKRSALILLTFVYLVSCLGIAVNRYYCCGQLASIKLVYGGETKKDARSAKKRTCCRHEYQTFKIKDTHFNAPGFTFNSPSPVILPTFAWVSDVPIIQLASVNSNIQDKAPPGIYSIPLYIQNCTYRV